MLTMSASTPGKMPNLREAVYAGFMRRTQSTAECLVSDDARPLDLKTVSGGRPVQVVAPGPFVKQVLQIEVAPG
jgi:hypothetical protein